MSLEKRISTIRKALHSSAEEKALGEFKDSPEKKHYDETINFFRYLKDFEPEKFELVVKIGAEGKELKDEMGLEKYKIFMDSWDNICSRDDAKLKVAGYQIEKSDMPLKVKQEENIKLTERFYDQKSEEIRRDQNIINTFEGKEDLLNRAILFTVSTALKMLKFNQDEPKFKILDKKEHESLQTKIIKYLRRLN